MRARRRSIVPRHDYVAVVRKPAEERRGESWAAQLRQQPARLTVRHGSLPEGGTFFPLGGGGSQPQHEPRSVRREPQVPAGAEPFERTTCVGVLLTIRQGCDPELLTEFGIRRVSEKEDRLAIRGDSGTRRVFDYRL